MSEFFLVISEFLLKSCFILSLVSFWTSAWQLMLGVKHLLSSRQPVHDLQSQPNADLFGYQMFLLRAGKTDPTLPIQL